MYINAKHILLRLMDNHEVRLGMHRVCQRIPVQSVARTRHMIRTCIFQLHLLFAFKFYMVECALPCQTEHIAVCAEGGHYKAAFQVCLPCPVNTYQRYMGGTCKWEFGNYTYSPESCDACVADSSTNGATGQARCACMDALLEWTPDGCVDAYGY